jgi:hypothetical protein
MYMLKRLSKRLMVVQMTIMVIYQYFLMNDKKTET